MKGCVFPFNPITNRSGCLCYNALSSPKNTVPSAREKGTGYSMDASEHDISYSSEEIAAACSTPLHPEALHGLHLFNAGEYFEAHEALETAWRDEHGPIRDLYRGILQVGVAYYHIQRGNYRGARKMFQRCRQWLDPFPACCCGIDLAGLRRDFMAVEERLIRLGPRRIELMSTMHFQPITYQNQGTKDGS
jgi:uncharacterized protein